MQFVLQIISEAIRHGDCHTATMEMADFWLLEKQLIHKLFKVLVPRFQDSTRSYTRFFAAPRPYFGDGFYKPRKDMHIDPEFAFTVHWPRAVLELRGKNYLLCSNEFIELSCAYLVSLILGNPYPPLLIPQVANPRSLHNVLLWAAREEKRKKIVEDSFREEGLLSKSEHLEKILARSKARSQKMDILGRQQDQLTESAPRESKAATAESSELKSELPPQNLNDKSSEASHIDIESKSDSPPEKPTESSKTS